jgi:hypothetical protein
MTRKELEQLAESAWEGCHHCDENDRYFWMNGFMIGYLNAQVDNIDDKKNKMADSVIKNVNKQNEY